ncbi:tetratricopeptide repeat protein [Dactylosporangium sp. NPDC051484]|uniref:sensor histidine kinase n=1 Tax=Dactylosporangium sp. NPDC051484 TaxID=3154942 RepID=UPI00344D2280
MHTPHAQALIQHVDGRGTDAARLHLSISAIAAKMRNAGELDEARQLVEQVLANRRRVLGPAHPNTLASITDLAATLSADGDHRTAVALLEDKVALCRRTYGEQHPETLAAHADLESALAEAVSAELDARRPIAWELFRSARLLSDTMRVVQRYRRDENDPARLARLDHVHDLLTQLGRRHEVLVLLLDLRAIPPRLRPVPLAEVLRTASTQVEHHKRVELADVTISGAVDPNLALLFSELLDNATRFSPPHTVVRVTADRDDDGQVVVEIEDAGLGMREEHRQEANDRLRSVRPLHRRSGHGSWNGLHVVSMLAAQHGVEVTLLANAHHGTTARVLVPPQPGGS